MIGGGEGRRERKLQIKSSQGGTKAQIKTINTNPRNTYINEVKLMKSYF